MNFTIRDLFPIVVFDVILDHKNFDQEISIIKKKLLMVKI